MHLYNWIRLHQFNYELVRATRKNLTSCPESLDHYNRSPLLKAPHAHLSPAPPSQAAHGLQEAAFAPQPASLQLYSLQTHTPLSWGSVPPGKGEDLRPRFALSSSRQTGGSCLGSYKSRHQKLGAEGVPTRVSPDGSTQIHIPNATQINSVCIHLRHQEAVTTNPDFGGSFVRMPELSSGRKPVQNQALAGC